MHLDHLFVVILSVDLRSECYQFGHGCRDLCYQSEEAHASLVQVSALLSPHIFGCGVLNMTNLLLGTSFDHFMV